MLVVLSSTSLWAGTDYYALVIRSSQPPDSFLVEKFKLSGKDKLYELPQPTSLSKSQYEHLPVVSFADVYAFRVAQGHLEVRTRAGRQLAGLPQDHKPWPKGPLEGAVIIRGSSFSGRMAGSKQTVSALLKEGWTIYMFPSRPGDDAVAFALAETQNAEETWQDFLARFPGSPQVPAARQALALAYLQRAQQAATRYQEALREQKPGYTNLLEARQWFNRIRPLNVQASTVTDFEAVLNQLETELRQALQQARLQAENADFPGALALLEPLRGFREEFPDLAATLEDIHLLAARHHLNQARARLAQIQFDEADRELNTAASYQALPEIPPARREIEQARLLYQRQQEIQQARDRARQAMARNDYAAAFDLLGPLAPRYTDDSKLQEEFATLRRLFTQSVLGQAGEVEKLHTPIRGPADLEVVLRLHGHFRRLSEFESAPALTVWRDRLSLHLADYYRRRAADIAKRQGPELIALGFAYLQQAQHFTLNKYELPELAARRAGLENQLGLRVALNFRDLTPEATGQYLVAELSAQVGSSLQGAGFLHLELLEARSDRAGPPGLELIVELLEVSVRDDAQEEAVRSEYSAGFRQVPNPGWREAKTAYDRAVEDYEQLRARLEQNRRQKKYSDKQRQADDAALAAAQSVLKDAKVKLDALPAFEEQEDIRPYEFVRRRLTRTALLRLTSRWVNTATGAREAQQLLEVKEPATSVETAGVHPADQQGHRNQPASLPEAAILRGRVLRKIEQQVTERALDYLKAVVERDFLRAQQLAQQAGPEAAGEHYLRFLFNSPRGDPRRLQARDYLERQLYFVALEEWLAVPGDPAAR